jgi:hypothetical protein
MRACSEQNEDELALATVDLVNRELGHPAAMALPTQDPTHVTAWLEQAGHGHGNQEKRGWTLAGVTRAGPSPGGSARPSADDGSAGVSQ